MKARDVSHIAIVLATVVGLSMTTSAGQAQVREVQVRVDGLSCPFCAYSLEKQITKVSGVHEPVIDFKEGTVTFEPIGGATVDYADLPRAVERAGFTPRDVRVRGVGRSGAHRGAPAIVSPTGDVLFQLMPSRAGEALGEDPAWFTGRLVWPKQSIKHKEKNALWVPQLEVTAVEPLSAGSDKEGTGEQEP